MSEHLWDDLSNRISALRARMPSLIADNADQHAQRLAFVALAAPITEAARAADELFQDGVMMMLDEILIEHGLMDTAEHPI